jgi:hypothetical protein
MTAVGNGTGILVGSNTTTNKVSASYVKLVDCINYDMNLQYTDGIIDINSGEIDSDKINNPNEVTYNARFHTNKDGDQTQTITGRLKFGTASDPSNISMGEGKYNINDIIFLTNTDLEAGTWTNMTDDAISNTGSTFNIFSDTGIGNCFYIGSTKPIVGFKINVTTSTNDIYTQSDIIMEYWNGSLWTEFYVMNTLADPPFYCNTDHFICIQDKQQVRFGLTTAAPFVNKSLNGFTKKWIRGRLAVAISNLPQAEYIKLHVNQTEVGKDGFVEHFGNSRTHDLLPWMFESMEILGSSLNDQPVYMYDNIGIDRTGNRFDNGVISRKGRINILPKDIDISFPIKFTLSFIGDSDNSGDVIWNIRWISSNIDSNLYRSTLDAPNTLSDENIKTVTTSIPLNHKDKETRQNFTIEINHMNPNPSSKHPDNIWIMIERDGVADTYDGNITMVQTVPYYIR